MKDWLVLHMWRKYALNQMYLTWKYNIIHTHLNIPCERYIDTHRMAHTKTQFFEFTFEVFSLIESPQFLAIYTNICPWFAMNFTKVMSRHIVWYLNDWFLPMLIQACESFLCLSKLKQIVVCLKTLYQNVAIFCRWKRSVHFPQDFLSYCKF